MHHSRTNHRASPGDKNSSGITNTFNTFDTFDTQMSNDDDKRYLQLQHDKLIALSQHSFFATVSSQLSHNYATTRQPTITTGLQP